MALALQIDGRGQNLTLGLGLMEMAKAWLVFYTAYRVLSPGGIAERHFEWKPELTHAAHRRLRHLGLVVLAVVLVVTLAFVRPGMVAPLWVLVFAVCGAGLLGTLGLIAGLWAEKFDQMAAFQNFLIMPMTFLSGVFYSISSLPPFWQTVSHLNPFFYMIDGFRYGFFGVSDVSPWVSISLVAAAWLVVSGLALHLLRIGYKIRN